MNNVGKKSYRLKCPINVLENEFAVLWDRLNSSTYSPTILDYLLAEDTNSPKGEVTERDIEVASTVIQWLGSPVGQDFLNSLGFKQYEQNK